MNRLMKVVSHVTSPKMLLTDVNWNFRADGFVDMSRKSTYYFEHFVNTRSENCGYK